MSEDSWPEDIQKLFGDLPAQVDALLAKYSQSSVPDYDNFVPECHELLKPFVAYSDKKFHQGTPSECFRKAMNVLCAAKWDLLQRLGPTGKDDAFKKCVTNRNRLKLLLSYFHRPGLLIIDIEYQLERETSATERAKLVQDRAKQFAEMGIGAFTRARTWFDSGQLEEALAEINKAIESTPDTVQAYAALKAKILRTMAAMMDHAALDDNPEHPAALAQIKLTTQIDGLREVLERKGMDVESFLEQVEKRVGDELATGRDDPKTYENAAQAMLLRYGQMDDEIRLFLATAECLWLTSLNWHDLSPIAIEYAKAVERALLYMVFKPFRSQLPTALKPSARADKPPMDRFLSGGRDLTLGEMATLVRMALKRPAGATGSPLDFLRASIVLSFGLNNIGSLAALLDQKQVQDFRNRPAHPEPVDRASAERTRNWAYSILRLF